MLAIKIVAIAAATMSPRVLATSKDLGVGYTGEGLKTCKEGEGWNEEHVGWKVTGSNPGAGKVLSC